MIELNGDFSWSSSNPSVVEIIGKKMYARKAGKAVLTVSTPLNSASVTVTVKAAPTATPKPTKTPTPKPTATPKLVPVYRLFNIRTGEHFYTAKVQERKEYLLRQNWKSEGIAWYAPEISNEPIYRVSNPNNSNEHHYTKSVTEKNWLVSLGWKDEGIAWYSDPSKKVPIYRHYHPKQRTGNHHYTTSKGESDHIVKYEGWNYEGIAFYVSKAGG